MISRQLLRQATHLHTPSILSGTSRVAQSSIYSRISSFPCRLPAPHRARVVARWYAAAAEQAESEGKSSETSEAPPAPTEEDTVKTEMQKKDREIIDLKDRYLRSIADFRNLQERSRREQVAARDFAITKFAKDLIESVDNLDLALSNVPQDKVQSPDSAEEDPYKELRELNGGLKMTSSILLNTLSKHGLERNDPSEKGEVFDPNIHEAAFQAPQPDKEDGTVFHTVQKGFTLNGRVIRAPKVGVVKNS